MDGSMSPRLAETIGCALFDPHPYCKNIMEFVWAKMQGDGGLDDRAGRS
jgi:hypothetical protein